LAVQGLRIAGPTWPPTIAEIMVFGAANSASTRWRCRGGIGMDELGVSPPIFIDLPLAGFG
jgi:hypothetical protein